MDRMLFVCQTTHLNIHDLPTDILVHIFSFLHGQDITRCIQYKIELAQNGMVNGHSSTISTSERLQRLREYSSKFCSRRFDHEDLTSHPHYICQMRNGQWNVTQIDGPPDMFLSTFTPGSAQAGIQSSHSLLRISTADGHAILVTKWAIDGAQDLLVISKRADIAMPEHLRPQPDEFHIHFYSLSGSKASGQTPHPAAKLPSVVLAVFVGVCDWKTGEIISWINVGTPLLHVIPLGYPYLLLIPKAFQNHYPHFSLYSFALCNIPNRPICTLLVSNKDSHSEETWYNVHTGDHPQTSNGHFHANLSLSMLKGNGVGSASLSVTLGRTRGSLTSHVHLPETIVLKLATDGSNWVTYQVRMQVVQAAKGHMPHIHGTAHKPPLPPPVERVYPHIPPTAPAAATTVSTTAQPKSASQPSSPTAKTMTLSTPDAYSHLTNDEYAKLVEKMDAKYCTWETKEADARALIYETLGDDLFIEVQAQPTVKALWEAVVSSCENKSLMYANAIWTRI
ncbi:hypothetical protein V8D89_009415 [Ganoderma adspersum]